LRAVPAAVRFISAEPLLGPLGELELDGIHWLIAGGGERGTPPPGRTGLGESSCATGAKPRASRFS
jgi:hypothetical protein